MREEKGYNEEMFGEEPSASVTEAPQPREVQTGPDALLARQLRPGERLLWQGRPLKAHSRMRGPFGKMFALVFFGFACVWELMALQSLGWGFSPFQLIFPLFGIPFLLVGLKMLFPGLLAGRKLRQTVYAITDQRALVVTDGRVVAWPLDTVCGVEKYYYKDGTGDLVLSNGQVEHYRSNGHYHTRNVTLDFSGIPDVDAAEAALQNR